MGGRAREGVPWKPGTVEEVTGKQREQDRLWCRSLRPHCIGPGPEWHRRQGRCQHPRAPEASSAPGVLVLTRRCWGHASQPRLRAKGVAGGGNAPGCAAWGCESCAITSELDLLLCFYLFIFLKQKTKAKNQQRTNKQTKHYHGTCFCLWASPKVGRYFCFFSKSQQVRQFFILRTFSPPPPKGLIIYRPCKLCENPKY